jgi:hypothetical protein
MASLFKGLALFIRLAIVLIVHSVVLHLSRNAIICKCHSTCSIKPHLAMRSLALKTDPL